MRPKSRLSMPGFLGEILILLCHPLFYNGQWIGFTCLEREKEYQSVKHTSYFLAPSHHCSDGLISILISLPTFYPRGLAHPHPSPLMECGMSISAYLESTSLPHHPGTTPKYKPTSDLLLAVPPESQWGQPRRDNPSQAVVAWQCSGTPQAADSVHGTLLSFV